MSENEMSGKPYRPSNGTEGDWFMERFCNNCVKSEGDYWGCDEIIGRSMFLHKRSPEYPKELIYDSSDMPTCTAFKNKKRRIK